jgi:prepilin-type N-terminal cleavage/methylation domain-containing protein
MKKLLPNVRNNSGFTLIELLIVMAIIAALAVVVFVALNPAGRLIESRDARRTSDVDTLLTAVHQYIVDNKGILPSGLNATEKQLGTAGSGCALTTGTCNTAAACLDLSTPLNKYLKEVPVDPLGTTGGFDSTKTGYSVVSDANGIVTVKACGTGTGTTEGTANISSSR